MRAAAQAIRTSTGLKPTRAGRSGSTSAGRCGHDPPDIIFLGGHHASQSEVARDGLAVQLVAGNVALLDPHHASASVPYITAPNASPAAISARTSASP